MARQQVDIGVEGNDGTGDSIRESFRKVNENFQEIYAVVGKGGQITFTLLGDTPDSLDPYQGDNQYAYLPIVKQDGTGIEVRRLASNEDDPNSAADNTISVKVSEDGLIILSTDNIQLIQDSSPSLGGPLNAGTVAIANIGTSQQDIDGFNTTHNTTFTVDDLVIDKKFADKRYLPRQLPGEDILVPSERTSADILKKTFTITSGGYLLIPNHGFTSGSNGAEYVLKLDPTNPGLNWNFTIDDPTTGAEINYSSTSVDDDGDPVELYDAAGQVYATTIPLVTERTVYINVRNSNELGVYLTKDQSLLGDIIDSGPKVTPVNLIVGRTYRLEKFGTTTQANWNTIAGTTDLVYEVGDIFVATSLGQGSGQITEVITESDREKARLKLIEVNGSFAPPSINGVAQDKLLQIWNSGYDETLEGFFTRQQVLPRESVVRRQGDIMDGPLYLQDHPGDLAGAGNPNGITDLQAVSKLYVDSQSTESSANIFVSSVGDDDQSLAPRGKQGSSLAYAYRTVGEACRRAEELNISSGFEPGPYMQDIIIERPQEDGTNDILLSQVSDQTFLGVLGSRANAKSLVDTNKDFIIAETLAWLNAAVTNKTVSNLQDIQVNWNGRVIEERRLELLLARNLNASILDHITGTSANTLSYRVGVEYFKDEYELSQAGLEKDVWITLLDTMRTITSAVLANPTAVGATALVADVVYQINDLGDTNQASWNTAAGTTGVVYSVGDRFTAAAATTGTGSAYNVSDLFANLQSIYRQVSNTQTPLVDEGDQSSIAGDNGSLQFQINILKNGVFTTGQVVPGDRVSLAFTNADRDSVAQGLEANRDLRVGKVIRGKSSGALGRIITYTAGGDGGADDVTQLELLEPIEFQAGENLEFGNLVAAKQITIRIETGTYYEDYPIRVPAQTSLVGDEFRRVLIRPKSTVSTSVWSGTYFYRDRVFDGLTGSNSTSVTGIADPNLPTAGTAYYDPLLNLTPGVDEPTGYFGRHYLVDPARKKDVFNSGLLDYTQYNPGGFTDAANLIEKNRGFIIDETIAFIEEQAEGDLSLTPPNQPNIDYVNITSGGVVQPATKDRYRRTISRIVDSIAADLRAGGLDNLLNEQGELFFDIKPGAVYSGERIIYNQMLANIRNMLLDIVVNTPYERATAVDSFVGVTAATQYFNTSFTAAVDSPLLAPVAATGQQDPLLIKIIELLQYPCLDNSNYNPAKRSSDVDVFLMNDATILRNMSVQGHGGFMCVLDPEGQILTKSPYIQTGSSFSQSLNRQAFRGGMLVDAFTANTPLEVTNIDDQAQVQVLTVRGEQLSALSERKPQMPAPFYINGTRFQVNDIFDYDPTGNQPSAKLILDKATSGLKDINGAFIGWDETILPLATYADITLQTAGNRSQLGNDFTQINDLGYGLVTINGGLSEMVSMFTYYCWTGYYAGNGGQIRSLNGSTCNGQYGLASVGSDPNEVPDSVQLVGDMTQPAFTFSADIVITPSTPISVTAGDTITGSTGDGSGTVAYSSANAQKIFLTGVTGTYNQGSNILNGGSPTGATFGNIDTTGYNNLATQLSLHVYNLEEVPNNKGELDYYHNDTLGGTQTPEFTLARYEVSNVQRLQGVVIDGYDVNFDDAADKPGASSTVDVAGNSYAYVGADALSGEPGYAIYQARVQDVAVDGVAITDNDESYPFVSNTHAQIAIGKVRRNSGQYTVSILNDEFGDHYKVGDQFLIYGTTLGGTSPANDATVTITEVGISIDRDVLNLQTGSIRRLEVSGNPATSATTPLVDGQVYKLNFSTSNDEFDNDGLLQIVPGDEPLTIRNNQAHLFDKANDVNNLTIRPSTAVNFQDDPKDTYRSISFGKANAAGDNLDIDETLTGFDASYDYVRMIVDEAAQNYYINGSGVITATDPGSASQLGAVAGNTTIAIDILPEYNDIWRLNNNLDTNVTYRPTFFDANGNIVQDPDGETLEYSAELPKVLSWRGKKHYVYNYREYVFRNAQNDYVATEIFGETNSFAVVDLKEIKEVTLQLNGNAQFNRLALDGATLVNAIVRQVGNTGANGKVKYKSLADNEIKLFDWSETDFNTTGALEISYDDGDSYTVLADVVSAVNIVPTAQDHRETNLTTQAGDGIAEPITTGANQNIILRAGLQDAAPAKITINISTCRATGHDMLDVGTGSFNQTNYPNVLLGFPAQEANQANEVQERTKGRVFYVTTDQDGFFRVGRFFTVDQGTGTVTFAASIALSDVDGIGFKRGVVVTEFSTDTAMSDNAIDTVPTESAVRGYVNRRLGFDQAGAPVTNSIGPKILAQNGSVPLTGDLQAANNTITGIANVNLSDNDGSIAVNRDYVDGKTEYFNKFKNMRDTVITAPDRGHILGYTGTKVLLIDSQSASGNNFDVGRVLCNSNASEIYGTIVGETSYYDRTFGSTLQITYFPTATEFNGGLEVNKYVDNSVTGDVDAAPSFAGVPIYTATATVVVTTDPKGQPSYAISNPGTPGGAADAINGPFDEIINIQEEPFVDNGAGGTDPVSDIGLYIRRQNTTSQDVSVPDDPTAYYNLQINDEVIVNQDVAPDAAILQSKLSMQLATTEAAAPTGDATAKQARSGLTSFDSANFEITDGWVGIKNNGISLAEIQQIGAWTVIGNADENTTATATAVSFETVADKGGAILHKDLIGVDFDATTGVDPFEPLESTGAVVRTAGDKDDTADGVFTYEVINISTAGSKDSIVKTDSTGIITASNAGFKLADNVVISESAGGVTSYHNGAGGLMFTSSGTGTSDTNFAGNINIGGLTDPDINGDGLPEVFGQSELQTAQADTSKFVASGWMYTKFIEDADAKGAQTTGISLGAGSGLTEEGEVAIVVPGATNNDIPAKFTATAITPSIDGNDGTSGFDIGSSDYGYKHLYIHDIDAAGAVTIGESLAVGTTLTVDGDFVVNSASVQKFKVTESNGNIETVGTLAVGAITSTGTLEVGGSISLGDDGNGDPLTGDIGSTTNPFATVHAATFTGTAAQAQYADLAENYVSDNAYEPGTVVVFGGSEEVTITNTKGDHRVAGVVSTNPAYLMNSHQEGDNVAAIALAGRVPCMVIGPVQKGDILVTSATAGFAVVNNTPSVGTVIGKSLETNTDNIKGIVEVVVGKA